ncbi:MAG: hypothetical protein LJE74_10310 [Proteobacteria bacterium]|jgi:hypothetical protein|nr:hypothetical protein [Pseudomonadota bacterium]
MTEISYQALTRLGGEQAHIRFQGKFQNQTVIWDTQILTLAAVYRQLLKNREINATQSVTLSQFMEIKPAEPGEYSLRIGLDVPCIDEPTVFKTIIMINNYKQLQLGRLDYQPSRTFPIIS